MAKGFKVPKGGGGQMGMMQQLQKLQEQIESAQAQLAEETVTATVGGGAVKVTLTGDQQCKAVSIDPALLEDADVEIPFQTTEPGNKTNPCHDFVDSFRNAASCKCRSFPGIRHLEPAKPGSLQATQHLDALPVRWLGGRI